MIKHSFIFLEKMGSKKEQSIWQPGIKDWHDFLTVKEIKGISKKTKYYYDRQIKEAQKALQEENYTYFLGKLPQKEMWRMYDLLRDECIFLDIETDGYGRIIVVGISNYYHTNFFVKGVNLTREIVEKELSKFKLIITFNGSSFDLPKLKRQLGLRIEHLHIDLKHLCIKLGLKGGLKEIEKILNLKRPPHLYGNPVELWKAFHASGDREWLELLLEYNREDMENLKFIMEKVYKEMSTKIYKQIRLAF